MTELHVQSAALVAMLASLPLVSWGSTDGPDAVTVVGGLLLALGLVALTALRYLDLEDDS